jgi:redox-sensitive bicupin YhaK (pirin superfamily)
VVPFEQLRHDQGGITAGQAHVGFDDYPAEAPGHLDFHPMQLCAIGEVEPGTVAKQHPHANAEIVDVIVRGGMDYADSLGNRVRLGPGAVAATSAGEGMCHGVTVGEDEALRGLILFFEPTQTGGTPRVTWNADGFDDTEQLRTLVSGRATAPASALPVRADVDVRAARPRAGARLHHHLAPGRGAYLLSLAGDFSVDGQPVRAGDRVLVEGPGRLEIEAQDDLELFLIDLPRP